MNDETRLARDTHAVGAHEVVEGDVITGAQSRRHLYGSGHTVLMVDGDPDVVLLATTGGIYEYPPQHTVYIAR